MNEVFNNTKLLIMPGVEWLGLTVFSTTHSGRAKQTRPWLGAQTAALQGQITDLLGQIKKRKCQDAKQREWAKQFCNVDSSNPMAQTLMDRCIEQKANSPEAPKFSC